MPEKKYDLIKEIRTKYSPETVKLLIENNITYQVCEYKDYSPYQTKEEIEKEFPLIEIPEDLFQELKRLCKINNIDVYDKIIRILREAVNSGEIIKDDGSNHVINF